MKFDWQQLSPKEKEVLLRHFLLKRNMNAPVTAEKVCAALHETHYVSFHTDSEGKAKFRFVTNRKGARSGSSVSDNLNDGIFKAALRAKGVELVDEWASVRPSSPRSARLVTN